MGSVLSFGQTKLDLQLSSLAKQGKVSAAKGIDSRQSTNTVTIIGVLADDVVAPVKTLEDMGIKVTFNAYGVVTMMVPVNMIADLENLKEFTSLEANKPLDYTNYTSKKVEHVLELNDAEKAQAEGLPQVYNGEGVIVGTLDCGIDFNHVNFRDPVTHKSRFKEVILANGKVVNDTIYDESGKVLSGRDAIRIVTGEDIDTLTTDYRKNTHGCHTLSTFSGSYAGDYLDKDGNVVYTNQRGAAYKADIVAAGMNFNSRDMIMTVTDEITRYADSVGKPLVLSYSFGDTGDWLDGKLAINKFFDNWSDNGNKPGRIVCFAAGNSGYFPYTIHKELNEGNDYTMTAIVGCSSIVNGVDAPTEVKLFNSNDAELDISYEILDTEKNVTRSLSMDELIELGYLDYQKNSDHDNRTNGILRLYYTGTDGTLKRDGDIKDPIAMITIKSKDRIACKPRLYSLCNDRQYQFIPGDPSLYTSGDDKSSFNYLACTNSVLSVGAWTANLYSKTFYEPGSEVKVNERYPLTLNDVASFSSYVTNDDNDVPRPDICAPGVGIISGLNSYYETYFDNDGNPKPQVDGKTNKNTVGRAREEYGRQDGHSSFITYMDGTSMSCPNAAGIIALWLQANPLLTTNQVREIIRATADKDEFTAASPAQFGAGKINALAGLKYILKNYPTAIHKVEGLEEPTIQKVMEDGQIILIKNGAKYNVSGQRL